jgi:hypothetical protein
MIIVQVKRKMSTVDLVISTIPDAGNCLLSLPGLGLGLPFYTGWLRRKSQNPLRDGALHVRRIIHTRAIFMP